jgi:competence protein ComEA
MQRWGDLCTRARAWVWAPIVGKVVAWVAAFAVLSHVGASAAARLGDGPTSAAIAMAPVPQRASAAPCASARAASDAARKLDGASGGGVLPDGRVVLNRATVTDLRRLPGVGERRAAAIVELRDKLGGRFRHVRDLGRVRGIGMRSLKRLEPLVVLDPPSDAAGSAASAAPPPSNAAASPSARSQGGK